MEVWKDIKGYEGLYQVSNYGRVKSLQRDEKFCKRPETILKPFVCGSGYQEIILHSRRARKPLLIHRLVAEAFIPNHDGKKEVNHKNGNKLDNSVDNLEWATPSENQIHSRRILKNNCSKKRAIVCVETGEMFESIKEGADKYGLQLSNIWKCCNEKQVTTGGYHWKYKEAE